MKKIYRSDWKTFIIIFTVLFSLLIFFGTLGAKDKESLISGLSLIVLGYIFLNLIFINTYVFTEEDVLTFFFPFLRFQLYPKKTSIKNITEINRQSTFRIFRGSMKSLYIFYTAENGKTKWMELRPMVFKEETMGKLVRDLKQLNLTIKLDAAAQQLMEQAK